MNFKEINISEILLEYFNNNESKLKNLDEINQLLKNKCGINQFFESEVQLEKFNNFILNYNDTVSDVNRREYGDFQTNSKLTYKTINYIKTKCSGKDFEFILEPTCGKGSFIIAGLEAIPEIKKIVGIEIYLPYVFETKFNILEFFIKNNRNLIPEIDIIHANVFEYNFEKLSNTTNQLVTMVIGNPPWVTNSELGSINSNNLPPKSNFKKHIGFDAITGKSNFDIGEYVANMMLKHFSNHSGVFGFLIKNSVAKNLIYEQKNNSYSIGNIHKLNINAKKEFNTSVDACFFVTTFNQESELICKEFDFYSKKRITTFGWFEDNFVYSIDNYKEARDIEGKSQFTWRQGIKHDCSKIMEIEKSNNHFINGFNQDVNIETDLVYGILKSSDLKNSKTNEYRKLTIVTQKKIGQETGYIKQKFPKTYQYLERNKEFFDKRKSSVYRGKPEFSIFGVGDYSFMPYKVAISGMYKTTHFTLVFPSNGKPIMLDDTCYFIGFERFNSAKIAHYLLNHTHTQKFLKSIIFPDSKRAITKDILMRIDFLKIYNFINFNSVKKELEIELDEWEEFGKLLNYKTENEQIKLF